MRVIFEGREYQVEGNYEPADVSTDADGRVAERFPADFEIVSIECKLNLADIADNPAFIEACIEAYEKENNEP